MLSQITTFKKYYHNNNKICESITNERLPETKVLDVNQMVSENKISKKP